MTLRKLLVVLLACAGLVGGIGMAPATAAELGATLLPGQTMLAGDTLRAANGAYRFTLQGDGNAVLYSASGAAQFATRTYVAGSTLTLQSDGNAVLYSPTRSPLWSSRTSGRPASRMTMQNDGNLVIYGVDGRATWSSRTGVIAPPPSYIGSTLASGQRLGGNQGLAAGNYRLLLQPDGNLVLRRDGAVVWHTGTQNNPGAYLIMQSDGNAVLYSAARRPLWYTATGGNPGSTLRLQTDGNLVLYRADGRALWSRLTGRIPLPSDKGWVLQSVQITSDFFGDFEGVARITNTNPTTLTGGWTITIFRGGQLVGTLLGSASDVAPGQTITANLFSTDTYVSGPWTTTFQTDWTF